MKSFFLVSFLFLFVAIFHDSVFSAEFGTLGENPGLDFYSRIDDAGDGLARGIVKRRITQYGTYGALGCSVGALGNERVNQDLLEEVSVQRYHLLIALASKNRMTLSTDQLNRLSQCLSEKYAKLKSQAYADQEALEMVGNIGLYNDGDTTNSDYDITSDIEKINSIIFKSQTKYTGVKNTANKSLRNMLSGSPIAPLFGLASSRSNFPASNKTFFPTSVPQKTNPETVVIASGSTIVPPWADMCLNSQEKIATGQLDTASLFDENFAIGMQDALSGGNGGEGVLLYYPPSAASPERGYGGATQAGGSLGGSAGDFHTNLPCEGFFCITLNQVPGSQNLLGGSDKDNSIEYLLDKHIKMLEPISWTDLSQQKMTNNTYQLPFLNIKFKNKIAGARVYMATAPQPTKNPKKEDTTQKKEDMFDAAYKCAMHTAGLSSDPKLVNGFIGAGYVPRVSKTLAKNTNTITPIGPMDTEKLDGCYTARIDQGRKEAAKSFANDLNEIQAFTNAISNIILETLDSDKKLDTLPAK